MPLPNPEKSETEQEFVSRCIGLVVGDGTVDNTPDGRAQGSAMCFRQYRDSKKSARTMRAYSLLNVKSFDEEQRVISGIATTPQTDLMEDVVDPKGAQFKLPIPFLYQHDSKQPIGHVRNARVTDDGIAVDVQLAKVSEPGRLKDRIDEAWQSIKHGLVRGLSIGFKDIESEPIKGSNWGRNIKKWSWLELSAVTIAANAEASITAIKQIDGKLLAASGRNKQTCPMPDPGESEQDYMDRCTAEVGGSDAEDICSAMWDQQMPSAMGKASKVKMAGASAKRSFSLKPKEAKMARLTIAERIANLEATRAADVAALENVNQKVADEGRTKDEAEQNQFDDLVAKIDGVDRELTDCRKMQKINEAAAVPVNGGTPQQAAQSRAGSVIQVKSPVPDEISFARTVWCKLHAHVFNRDVVAVAKEHYPNNPEIELALKAASTAATAQTATWATELALANNLASAFVSYLWPMALLGRIPGFSMVPFNVKIPKQTSGSGIVSSWVGEGSSKPVGQFTTATVTLRWAKTASIIAFTDELARFSNPSIESLVRDTLARGIIQFLDKQFFDPTVAAVTNVSPASITNGAANDPASGTDFNAVLSDVKQAFAHFQLFNVPLDGLVWVMEPTNAVGLSFLRTPLGTNVFTDITATGGMFLGFPVFTSPSVGAGRVVLMRPQDIFIAQDPGITIDVSREASIQLDTAPATPPTTVVSLWQQNLVAVRAERYITWARAHDESVYYITGATYGGVATAH